MTTRLMLALMLTFGLAQTIPARAQADDELWRDFDSIRIDSMLSRKFEFGSWKIESRLCHGYSYLDSMVRSLEDAKKLAPHYRDDAVSALIAEIDYRLHAVASYCQNFEAPEQRMIGVLNEIQALSREGLRLTGNGSRFEAEQQQAKGVSLSDSDAELSGQVRETVVSGAR